MTAKERREQIYRQLTTAPVSATALAKQFAVSRQVIVGDIALLRAEGCSITATARGYIIPDEGALTRNIYYATVLGLDLGMFYKRRDYSQIVDGRNKIIAHEYIGDSVEGKDIIVADDIISSGDSVLDLPELDPPESLCSAAARATGGRVSGCQLVFTGTCQDCLSQE